MHFDELQTVNWRRTKGVRSGILRRTYKYRTTLKVSLNLNLVPRAFPLKKWVGWEKAQASAGHLSLRTLCEKLKLCLTSQCAILGGLLYLLTINEKFYKMSFSSQTLAMVIFCFPPISMKGTASNICKTSVYRAVYRGINDKQAIIYA